MEPIKVKPVRPHISAKYILNLLEILRKEAVRHGPWGEGEYGERQLKLDLESKDRTIAQLKAKEFFFRLPVVKGKKAYRGVYEVQEGIFDPDAMTFRVCEKGEFPNALFIGRLPEGNHTFFDTPPLEIE
jgi:hypothetical protein